MESRNPENPMKKLSLDLEALSVESFRTDATPDTVRGTVRGASETDYLGTCTQSGPFDCMGTISQTCP